MRTRLFLLFVLAAVLVVVPSAAHGTNLHAQSNSQTYPDSIGENPNAPDITSVVVSNDNAGNIAMKVNISNRPALTPDMVILVYLDTDENASTGDPQSDGADYVLQLTTGSVALFQWNGTDFAFAQSQTSLTYAYDTTGASFHISALDLGKTKGFKFSVIAISGITTDANGNEDDTNAQADEAPDPGHGEFTYQVITKLTLQATGFTTAPFPARAGKKFAASLAATESDTGAPITSGTIACTATIGTQRLRATHKLANGVVTCFFTLPKKSKGKTIRGTVTVTVQGTKLTKPFSAKIF